MTLPFIPVPESLKAYSLEGYMQGNPEAIILLVHTATFGGIYAVAWWPSAATAVTQNLSPSTEEYILNKNLNPGFARVRRSPRKQHKSIALRGF